MKINVTPDVKAFFAAIGKKNGEKLKEKSKEKYGDTSEYFRRIAAMRQRFGRLSKKEKRERIRQAKLK